MIQRSEPERRQLSRMLLAVLASGVISVSLVPAGAAAAQIQPNAIKFGSVRVAQPLKAAWAFSGIRRLQAAWRSRSSRPSSCRSRTVELARGRQNARLGQRGVLVESVEEDPEAEVSRERSRFWSGVRDHNRSSDSRSPLKPVSLIACRRALPISTSITGNPSTAMIPWISGGLPSDSGQLIQRFSRTIGDDTSRNHRLVKKATCATADRDEQAALALV